MTKLNAVRPERALEDQVVDRDEADLRRGVGGLATSRSWASTSASSKIVPEGRRDLRPGALDVGGDRRRVGDDLVLEARVELHVARLVDLLGREEGRLLLACRRRRRGRRTSS